jgi:hypothetical protein
MIKKKTIRISNRRLSFLLIMPKSNHVDWANGRKKYHCTIP